MSPPKPYEPCDVFPDLTGSGSDTLLLQEAGDPLQWYQTWRNDYEIVSASNATPIVITTADSIAGKIVTGNKVVVQGVAGSSTANGTWTVTVLTGTTFSLDTSTAGGAGTGGRAYEVTLGAFSKLIDGLQYLWRRREVWARVQTSGAGTAASVIAGDGVASAAVVAVGGDYMIDVTLATAYANANIAPVVSSLDGGVGYSASVEYSACTASKVRVAVYDSTGTIVDVSSTVVRVAIQVQGPR